MQAIEFHAQRQLARLAARAEDDELEAICSQQLDQARQHEQRVEGLVEARGHQSSALEDKTLRAGAIGLRQLADIPPDTPPRVAIQLFGLEQLEIAGFELLRRIAEREDDEDAANTAREILERCRLDAEGDRAAAVDVIDRGAELQRLGAHRNRRKQHQRIGAVRLALPERAETRLLDRG